MRVDIKSSFVAFELTMAEEVEAYTYNDSQIAGIQNLIASAAEDIIRISLTSDELSLEAQKKLSYTRGQIDVLKLLLARADVIRETQQAERDDAIDPNQQNSL